MRMTVKELIETLLNFDMNAEVCIADNVEFENQDGKMYGSAYEIQNITESMPYVLLNFDNYFGFKLKSNVEETSQSVNKEFCTSERYTNMLREQEFIDRGRIM